MRRLRFTAPNLIAAVATALGAWAIAATFREAGALERIDLAFHDRIVQAVADSGPDDRFVLVLENEADLARWKFPLPDGVLADLIERILAAEPVAVAIDKYRDQPVGPGSERLDAILARADRVFWVARFGTDGRNSVPAPPALSPKLVGCADLVDDPDGNVRRALIYLDQNDRVCYSLAYLLARHAATAQGLKERFATDGSARLAFGQASWRAIDPGDGPYATIDSAGFQAAVPSAAGPPHMRTVGLSDVLDGRVAPETLRGRVVMFGSAAESLRDFFNIPSVSESEGYLKIPGVQVHALAASHLLRAAQGQAAPLRMSPPLATLAIAAFLAVSAALVSCSRKRPWIVIAAGVALLALYVSFTFALAMQGTYFATAAPAVALALAIAAGIARSAWLDNRERAQLMLIFSRHVSSEIADALWMRRDTLLSQGVILPRALLATVMFVDIRGFTTIFERLPADRAVPWLNRGLAVMTDEVMKRHGVVARFIGDAIMAVFGAPVPRNNQLETADDAFNAVCAGLALGAALDDLNREFSAEGLPSIRVRIGINTGTMTQCSVGTSRRMEFTVLGDAVNTASRLESFAMEDDGATVRVLVGEATMELLGMRFNTRSVGSMALKGKELPVGVHHVLSRRWNAGRRT